MRGWKKRADRARARRCRGDRGAVLVEFAILAPLLFLIIFGIIEFGWAYYQQLDVRHGAREGLRLAAVNYDPNGNTGANQATDIALETCNRLDTNTAGAKPSVQIQIIGSSAVGGEAEVTVRKPLQTLTGYLDFMLSGKTLSSTVKTRLEQTATWTSQATATSCP